MMTDLFEYRPPVVRETSIEAMRSVEPRAPNLRTRCLRVLQSGHNTADEVAEILGESILSVRPQFTLLTKENKIADTGWRRMNESGRQAIVWRANPPEMWKEATEAMSAREQIEALQRRVVFLEQQLRDMGVSV